MEGVRFFEEWLKNIIMFLVKTKTIVFSTCHKTLSWCVESQYLYSVLGVSLCKRRSCMISDLLCIEKARIGCYITSRVVCRRSLR